uniref:Uncharacterized protein n=1 Tax=Solanum lycopersicum TaxID=4081 RepID=K4D7V5_SOLLC
MWYKVFPKILVIKVKIRLHIDRSMQYLSLFHFIVVIFFSHVFFTMISLIFVMFPLLLFSHFIFVLICVLELRILLN